MPTKPAKLDADHRRTLDLLAGSRDGSAPEVLLIQAHGITADQITAMVKAGHVTISTSHMRAGGKVVVVRRLVITDAGRQTLRPRKPLRG
jgi:hypothetical protein